VWDTVQPATPHGVTGSREEHTSPTPATSVVGSMRSM
ncbi:MAG: DNA-binding protein, partial [Rhodococcus sp. (in: high G+C Gram-positive bacteria)]